MSTTKISAFHKGSTKKFTVTLSVDGVVQDITLDTVLVTFKKNKDDAGTVIAELADVATSGAAGKALFTLSTTDTDIAVRRYFIDILWNLSGGDKYVVYDAEIEVLPRISIA